MRKPRNSSQNLVDALPAVAVSVTVFASYCILSINGTHQRDRSRNPELTTGGFLAALPAETFRRLEHQREGHSPQSELKARLPHPSDVESSAETVLSPHSDRSSRAVENSRDTPARASSDTGRGWQHLSADVRSAIDAPSPARSRWDDIVLHHSSTGGGNASMLAMYHNAVRGLDGGLAYHFVIGNGAYSRDGKIEIGGRWAIQAPAGAAPGKRRDPRSISICLIGDFSLLPPTSAQLIALDELIHYLRAKLGYVPLRLHDRSDEEINSCPGRHFPREAVIGRLNPRVSSKDAEL